METDRRRKIEDGEEFDHLFPPPDEKDRTIKGSASVEDTMALIQRTVPLTLWHTEKIARKLKGKSLEETCSNIWHFVYNHIQYKRDKDGVEQVRSPRRTWWERKTGVDCDCYTEFISSILLNLNIPHQARITKYRKRYPETPRWQHVYPIVPRPGRAHKKMEDRDDYIVIDCVKDDFNDEQPFLECKDYHMRLDYLDGLDDNGAHDETISFVEHDNVDLADIASIYDADDEVGSILSKLKETLKKAGDKAGQGIRLINRYVNPATLLLRNGFLLAMKINLKNVGGRLRYAYLTDAQAKTKGINPDELKKLRAIKDRAETVYWQAGGKKANLKKAILAGKGNKDKKVPLSGLDGLDQVYADNQEYEIIHSENTDGLGELASGAALAAATSAVAAISAALKQVKGLFIKGGSEEKAFQSETDNAGTASSVPATIPEDEDAFAFEDTQPKSTTTATPKQNIQPTNEAKTITSVPSGSQPALPGKYPSGGSVPAPTKSSQTATSVTPKDGAKKDGFFQKTATWVKENPGKSLLVAGGILTGGYLLTKALSQKSPTAGLEGIPSRRKKKKHRKGKRNGTGRKQFKIKAQNLL